jgi:Fe-S-cluster containining protein
MLAFDKLLSYNITMRKEIFCHNPENVCLEHCNGACCKNMMFFNAPKSDLVKFSQKTVATEVSDSLSLSVLYDDIPYIFDGLRYLKNDDGSYDLLLAGKCPNLRPDGKCENYEDRPQVCKSFKPTGTTCNLARKQEGLEKITDTIPAPRGIRVWALKFGHSLFAGL